jgi:hypothetical protein
MTLMHNVTVRVAIEVLKKGDSWGSQDHIAKAMIEDTSSASMEEIAEKINNVANDAISRAQLQLGNTKRILNLEQQNKILGEPLK